MSRELTEPASVRIIGRKPFWWVGMAVRELSRRDELAEEKGWPTSQEYSECIRLMEFFWEAVPSYHCHQPPPLEFSVLTVLDVPTSIGGLASMRIRPGGTPLAETLHFWQGSNKRGVVVPDGPKFVLHRLWHGHRASGLPVMSL